MKIACQLYFAQDAVEFNTTFNSKEDRYKLKVCHISERAVSALSEQFGIKPKTHKNYETYIECKSKFKFIFKDDAGNTIDAKTIGNGTKAIVEITGYYDHKFDKQYGKGPVADSGVTITELVPYVASSGSGDEEAL